MVLLLRLRLEAELAVQPVDSHLWISPFKVGQQLKKAPLPLLDAEKLTLDSEELILDAEAFILASERSFSESEMSFLASRTLGSRPSRSSSPAEEMKECR
jgi:hypothetical protein